MKFLLWVFFALLYQDPDPHSQYGSGSSRSKSLWIHAGPVSINALIYYVEQIIIFWTVFLLLSSILLHMRRRGVALPPPALPESRRRWPLGGTILHLRPSVLRSSHTQPRHGARAQPRGYEVQAHAAPNTHRPAMEPNCLACHALQPHSRRGRDRGRGKDSLGSGPASQDDTRPVEASLSGYGGEAGRASAAPGPPGRMVKKLPSLTVPRKLKCQKNYLIS